MEEPANSTRYSVNASDDIVAVGGDWDRFALENGSPPELFSGNILNRSIWDFVSGTALQHVYRRIMAQVRAGDSLTFSFRCDSPELRRFLRLQMTPIADGGIEFVTETICTETRQFQTLFDANIKRGETLVVVCSWCNKIKTAAQLWQEPEDAIRTLSLFETDAIPALSHGMCGQCYQSTMDVLKTASSSRDLTAASKTAT